MTANEWKEKTSGALLGTPTVTMRMILDDYRAAEVRYEQVAARHDRMRNVLYTTFVSGEFYHAGERAMILQILNDDEKEGKEGRP